VFKPIGDDDEGICPEDNAIRFVSDSTQPKSSCPLDIREFEKYTSTLTDSVKCENMSEIEF